MTSLREQYLDIKTEYLYKSIYEKNLYNNLYIQKFGKYELEKKELLYKMFIYDQRMQSKLLFSMSTDLKTYSNVNLIDQYSDGIAQIEYRDLINHINELKNLLTKNDLFIARANENLNDKTKVKIRKLLKYTDPLLVNGERSKNLYESFILQGKSVYLPHLNELLDFAEVVQGKVKKNPKEVYEEAIESYKKDLEELDNTFPINIADKLNSNEYKMKQEEDYKEEIKKARKSLKKMSQFYLYSKDDSGLLN
ncbi:hypothetical protein [uncultured Helcococcus sp.]|uniref:hypothetical protein n=1 Tax=uncultured Helcococcus sp. TaxID=1072508 RepID=UPI0026157828|nr:hypothetical protein [uncultured Helcococcus sp.]